MSDRKALLVGSLPFENEEEAINLSLSTLGENLMSVPDGEIGERNERYPLGSRSSWVCITANECAEDTENWEIINQAEMKEDGFPVGYDTIYTLRPKHSPEELPKYLNLHYHEYFQRSYPIFKKMRDKYGNHDVKFQLGIPTGLTLSIFMLEPEKALTYYPAFRQRLIEEVNVALEEAANDIIVQLELPTELGMVYQSPSQIDLAIESIMGLVTSFHHPTQIGLHLCCGDLNNESWNHHPENLEKLVSFVNRLVEEWPDNQKLAYVHVPLAEGNIPPRLEKDFYQSLGDLQLPQHTQLFAGFVHEKRSIEELRVIRDHLDHLCSTPVGIACACGLGRRNPYVGRQLMDLMKQLLK